jgi:putative salt-induced outer membrane protein YdiY
MNSFRIITALAALIFAVQAHAARTDIIVLANGNAVTGEIESLDFGALEYGTDSMGTVFVDWEDIVSITSNQHMQVEITDGSRFFGNLEAADERFHIKVVTLSSSVEFATDEIIRITPIDVDETFVHRLEGYISFGFNTQNASGVSTMNLASDIRYRTQQYLIGLQANSTITDQPSEDTTERASVNLNYQRFKGNRWFTDWYTGWEKDDGVGLENRVTAGGALGRYLVQNNTHQFSLMAGLQASRELLLGEDDSTTQPEGRLTARYLFRKLNPQSSFNLTFNVYPLLEDFSQYRSDTDLALKYEFIQDLNFELTFFHTYVSEPPVGAEKEDYGVTTSLGYSF